MTQNSDHSGDYCSDSRANLGRPPDFGWINSWATVHLTWAGWVRHSWRFQHAEALCEVGPEMPERGSKMSTVQVVWATFGVFLVRDGVSRYVATPLSVALSPGHSDITRFRLWSPITTGYHVDRAEKIADLLRRLAPLTFLIPFRHFGTHFAESFCMSKSSWMMDPTRTRVMPSCSAIDLAKIRRSSKISSWNYREIPTWCNNLYTIINNSTCFGHLYAHLQEY